MASEPASEPALPLPSQTQESNPMQKIVPKPIEKILHPILVKCILNDLSDYNQEPIHAIRDYTLSLNAMFETRLYDSFTYGEDRNEIERLPAFHIYVKRRYINTFYTNTRPYQIIQDCVKGYLDELEKKKEAKKFWKNIYATCVKWVKKTFHRSTRMERYSSASSAKKLKKGPRILNYAHEPATWN
jgi:hypothetical protein